ncbi:hypothetical protein QYS49_29010 [Marivirga salinae]|uniref:Uncharacterized protein n=1 Tax=Marivirga salinarum TaxID=3059078 RepID=A0AA49JBF6_9BACT|nr:hypothetical protein [Marivirga sp. BDSF4-3]WKK75514.2 hypothetical protein QYS49_29010 [Marivirga sp. BDSF4-3]
MLTLVDGDYYLVPIQYASVDIDPLDPVRYPLLFDFTRCGSTLNASPVINGFTTAGFDNGDETYSQAIVDYTVTEEGDNVTINDGVSDIASGKMEQLQTIISQRDRK